jgi:protein-S-isoprenylcysteine O-methyltransferase Ste14
MKGASKHQRRTGWALVAGQFALLAAVVLAAPFVRFDMSPTVRGVGLVIAAFGVLLAVWAARHLGDGLTATPLPNGKVELVTTGPYRFMRHPMYSAVALQAGGGALALGSFASLGACGCLVVLLAFKARWEEARLVEAFPGYAGYRDVTPSFLPRIGAGH